MPALYGEVLLFGQENGPEVELKVWGDEFYARYETPDGYPVIYDLDRGLFCYALLEQGSYVSSGVALDHAPPQDVEVHAREATEVRLAKAAAKRAERAVPREGMSPEPPEVS